MRLLDTSHPFFKAAWRRYATVAVPFLWAGVEASFGSELLAYASAALGGFLAWHLILTWKDADAD